MEKKETGSQDWKQQVYNIVRSVALRWHLICLAAAAAAAAGDLFLTLFYVPQYRTEASFAMHMPEYGADGSEESEIAEAFQYILNSNVFLDKIREDLDINELRGTYSAEETPGTNIVTIAASAESPRTSYLMMYAMMDRYREMTDLVIGSMRMDILEKMSVPLQPSNQVRHGRNMLLFGAAGACAVIVLLAANVWLRDTVKDRNTVKSRLQIRLLGSIPSESKVILRSSGVHIKKGAADHTDHIQPEFCRDIPKAPGPVRGVGPEA